MTNLRDIKRKARRHLHEVMSVPAVYIRTEGDLAVPISVRVHTKIDALGMDGADGLAFRREAKPKLVFLRSELEALDVNLRIRGIVSVEPGEAYRLESSDPADGITITWYVSQLAMNETTGLPVPVTVDG